MRHHIQQHLLTRVRAARAAGQDRLYVSPQWYRLYIHDLPGILYCREDEPLPHILILNSLVICNET